MDFKDAQDKRRFMCEGIGDRLQEEFVFECVCVCARHLPQSHQEMVLHVFR